MFILAKCTRRSHLQLACAALAAHHVTAGAERGVDLLLAAQHAQQGLSELLQPLLQGPALLAAAAVQLLLVLLVVSIRGVQWRRALPAFRALHQVHNAGIVERAACVVVHLLGGTPDVENILFAHIDVFVEEKGSQVALKVSAVLHHHCVGNGVTPGNEKQHDYCSHKHFTLKTSYNDHNSCQKKRGQGMFYTTVSALETS